MTKREKYKSMREIITFRFDFVAILSLIIAFLSLIFVLPERQTFLDKIINVQLFATIISMLGFLIFGIWLFFVSRYFYLKKTMVYEVFISGATARFFPEIKIENKEPVKIQDIYIEMLRFSWNKQTWNDIDEFTVGDRFFSIGLPNDRSAARSPVYVKIAEAKRGFTHILLDNNTRNMPLNKQGGEFSKWAEYEFVFRVSGKFADENESISFGDYHAVLFHEQIQPHGDLIGQDTFRWKEFKETNEKTESVLKIKRKKTLVVPYVKSEFNPSKQEEINLPPPLHSLPLGK